MTSTLYILQCYYGKATLYIELKKGYFFPQVEKCSGRSHETGKTTHFQQGKYYLIYYKNYCKEDETRP